MGNNSAGIKIEGTGNSKDEGNFLPMKNTYTSINIIDSLACTNIT